MADPAGACVAAGDSPMPVLARLTAAEIAPAWTNA
jgi:hypothetical protein